MGLFGMIGSLAEVTVKTVLTPIAVVKDVVSVTIGEEATSTKDHIESIGDSLEDSVNEVV